MNRLRKLLANDRSIITSWCGWSGRNYIETLAACKFDAITLDMQHGLHTDTTIIEDVANVANSGKPAIVRIPVGRFEFASRALDIGAHAVIAPMINTVEDAKAFASFMKYPPIGDRSHGVTQAVHVLDCSVPDYLAGSDSQTMAFAMIETQEAVSNLDAILDVDGIDGVLVGPSDISISYLQSPVPDAFGEATIEVMGEIAAKTRAKNKTAALFCLTAERVDIAHAMGYRLMAIGVDSHYISQGAETMLSQVTFR